MNIQLRDFQLAHAVVHGEEAIVEQCLALSGILSGDARLFHSLGFLYLLLCLRACRLCLFGSTAYQLLYTRDDTSDGAHDSTLARGEEEGDVDGEERYCEYDKTHLTQSVYQGVSHGRAHEAAAISGEKMLTGGEGRVLIPEDDRVFHRGNEYHGDDRKYGAGEHAGLGVVLCVEYGVENDEQRNCIGAVGEKPEEPGVEPFAEESRVPRQIAYGDKHRHRRENYRHGSPEARELGVVSALARILYASAFFIHLCIPPRE